MTYGENGGHLRAEIATLLRQHRIQQRLGGPGIHTVPETTTPEQRRLLGEQIRRYRHAVLVWCHQAVAAASPRIDLKRTTERSRGPAEELRYRLSRAVEGSSAGHPPLSELSTEQHFPMVETWRKVARAAALGEHDFPAGVGYGALSDKQCMTVVRDAAAITQALVVLDQRYDNVPGWESLAGQGRLDRAAQVAAAFAGWGERDYTVDLRGWRPSPATIDGPPLPGIGGVVQAEHNMLVHLGQFPNALNLKRVVDSQRILSHELPRLAPEVAPELVEGWLEREQTYTRLQTECRNVGGHVGGGAMAAAEGANAFGRLRRVHIDEVTSPLPLHDMAKLFRRADTRIAAILEQGVSERLYFLRVKPAQVLNDAEQPSEPFRERYVPITAPIQTDLLGIVREDLRPPAAAVPPPAGAAESRQNLQEAIVHKPDRRRSRPPA